MDTLELFKQLVDGFYCAIPKKKRSIELRYRIALKLLDSVYGKNIDSLTLNECGYILGITRERVRQIEEVAVIKLRNPNIGGRRLKELINIIYEIETDFEYGGK